MKTTYGIFALTVMMCLPVFTACHKQTATSAANSACYAVDLTAPKSPSSIIQVKQLDDKLTLKVYTDNDVCIDLSGSFDGGVVFENQKNVNIDINMKDVRITSENNAGYLKLKSNDGNIGNKYTIILSGKSEIIGAADEESKSVISSKPNLEFKGDGSLSVVGRYKNGIVSDDVLSITSGTIDIKLDRKEAAQGDKYEEKGFAIKVDNGFEMSGGKLTIDATDNITNYESRGIKVDGSDKTSYHTGKGYVNISGGELTIRSDAKALSAGWEIDEDAKTDTTADDPHPDVIISGGVIDITTTVEPRGGRKMGPPPDMQFDENGNPMMPDFGNGARPPRPPHWDGEGMPPRPPHWDGEGMPPRSPMGKDGRPRPPHFGSDDFKGRPSPNKRRDHVDKNKLANEDGSSSNSVSPEGIEAKRNLIISGGKIAVRATDDGLNAGERIEISGGELSIWSTTKDALDGNGAVQISGGIVALFGAEDPEGGLDADRDENVSYTGGTVFAVGGANNAPLGEGTTGTFVAATLVESKFGPGMRGDRGPGERQAEEGEAGADAAPKVGASDENRQPGGPDGARKREKSELASATLVLADAESGQGIVSLKVPEGFTGGGSVLVLSDSLQKDKAYRVYTNPSFVKPVSDWHLDVISTEGVQVSGEKFAESTAGVALPGMFGPPMGGERRGPKGLAAQAENGEAKPQAKAEPQRQGDDDAGSETKPQPKAEEDYSHRFFCLCD